MRVCMVSMTFCCVPSLRIAPYTPSDPDDVAVTMLNSCRNAEGRPTLALHELQQQNLLRYIPFPGDLKGKYQSYTQADLTALRAAGYAAPFLTVEQGVSRYCHQLLARSGG